MILLAALVQVLDALTFLLAYDRYGLAGQELTPIPFYLYTVGGIPLVLLVKAGGVVAMSLLLVWIARINKTWALAGSWGVLSAGLAGMLVNTAAVMM